MVQNQFSGPDTMVPLHLASSTIGQLTAGGSLIPLIYKMSSMCETVNALYVIEYILFP